MTKRFCRQIGFGKPLLFWGFSLAFGLSRRTSMCSALSSHMLSLLYNQYYFIFAILPILLFFCGSVREDDPIIFVFRYESYKHYFTAKWRSLGRVMQRPMAGANNHSICDWCRAFRHKTRMGQFFRKQFA